MTDIDPADSERERLLHQIRVQEREIERLKRELCEARLTAEAWKRAAEELVDGWPLKLERLLMRFRAKLAARRSNQRW